MAETNFTQGEWKQKIYEHGGSRIWVDRHDGTRDLVADTYNLGDAHLIQNAREMYFKLEQVLDWLNRFGEHSPVEFGGEGELAQQIHALLAEARGETQ